MVIVRLLDALYQEIQNDLARPHEFAFERVGYVYGRRASLPDGGHVIALARYHPLLDAEYIDDPSVGARINSEAIRRTLEISRANSEGGFHVHAHPHRGQPWFSPTDRAYLPGLVRPFRVLVPTQVHGALLLSDDCVTGLVYLPGEPTPRTVDRVTVVGPRVREVSR